MTLIISKAPAIALLILAMALSGCGALAPQPTPTPTLPPPTQTLTATFTASPSASPSPSPTVTQTPLPTVTHTPVPTATAENLALPMPVGEPAADWDGVPVMPGAIAGEGDADGYLFTVKASGKEIQDYYQMQLAQQGYQLLGAGEGKNGNLLLIFTRDIDTVSLAVIDAGDGIMQVMIVK